MTFKLKFSIDNSVKQLNSWKKRLSANFGQFGQFGRALGRSAKSANGQANWLGRGQMPTLVYIDQLAYTLHPP